mgnify:FL=1
MVIGLNAELGRGIAMNSVFEFFNERLFYNSETGIFYWKNTELVSWVVRGKEAGTISQSGYRNINVKYGGKPKIFKAHRLAWLLTYKYFPEAHLDHINGDKLDNRICNLREVTVKQNMQNLRKANRNNKLGVLGVSYDKYRKYVAAIGINGKVKVVGRFDTLEEASNAYILAKREIHSFCTI